MSTAILTPHPPGLVEHAKLDRAFRTVLEAFEGGDPGRAMRLFADVVSALRKHFAREELALDDFAATDPEEARAILEEHVSLRADLDHLLGLVREQTLVAKDVYALKAKFSLHEAREERVFY